MRTGGGRCSRCSLGPPQRHSTARGRDLVGFKNHCPAHGTAPFSAGTVPAVSPWGCTGGFWLTAAFRPLLSLRAHTALTRGGAAPRSPFCRGASRAPAGCTQSCALGNVVLHITAGLSGSYTPLPAQSSLLSRWIPGAQGHATLLLDPRGAGTPCPQVPGRWSRGCSRVPCTRPEIHLVLSTVSLPPVPWLPLGAHLAVQAPAVKLRGTEGEAGLWLAGSSSEHLTSP